MLSLGQAHNILAKEKVEWFKSIRGRWWRVLCSKLWFLVAKYIKLSFAGRAVRAHSGARSRSEGLVSGLVLQGGPFATFAQPNMGGPLVD